MLYDIWYTYMAYNCYMIYDMNKTEHIMYDKQQIRWLKQILATHAWKYGPLIAIIYTPPGCQG